MLLSINLQGTETLSVRGTIRGELPAQPGLPADTTAPVGGFAELLGLRLPVGMPDTLQRDNIASDAASGESLPAEGKDLPQASSIAADWDIDWTATAVVPAQPGTVIVEPVTTAAKHQVGMSTPGSEANKPATSVESRHPWWNTQLQRDAVTATPQTPTNPVVTEGMDNAVVPLVAARPLREVSRPVTLPASLSINDDTVSLPTADDVSSPDALLRRMAAGDEGDLRQQVERDRLPAKQNFTMQAPVMAASAEDSGATLLAGVSTGKSAASLTGNASVQVDNVTALQPAAVSPPPPVRQTAPGVLQRIDVPMQDSSWGDALNERVTFMAGKEIRNAEIRLNPAELGPIRVQLTVDDRGTSVTFAAHHAQTREAIEQALPRLRELFLDQGLSLGQASVSDQGVRHERDGQGREAAEWLGAEAEPDDAEVIQDSTAGSGRRAGNGLVDTFA